MDQQGHRVRIKANPSLWQDEPNEPVNMREPGKIQKTLRIIPRASKNQAGTRKCVDRKQRKRG